MFSLSAFIAKLIPIGGALLQNVNTSPKSKHEENADMSESDSDIEVEEQVSAIDIGKKSRCLLEILMHNVLDLDSVCNSVKLTMSTISTVERFVVNWCYTS